MYTYLLQFAQKDHSLLGNSGQAQLECHLQYVHYIVIGVTPLQLAAVRGNCDFGAHIAQIEVSHVLCVRYQSSYTGN